jgi:P27 family predicted phage terminase small subunit
MNALPIGLHLYKGNPNRLTKEEIEKRQQSELRIGDHNFVIPQIVKKNKHAKNKWNEIINLYKNYGVDIVTTSDVTILERYCLTYAEYINLQEVKSEILKKGWDKVKTYHAITELNLENNINKKMDILIKMEDRLFLTPLAKVKNVIPKSSESEKDPNAVMFGD